MNEKIQTDLENLWKVGSYHLPALATVYADTAGKVHAARTNDAGLFETPGMPAGGKSALYYKFSELRDQLQVVARNTTINLRDSGAGCVKAANAFSETDLSNAERLDYEATKAGFGENHKVTPPENPPTPSDPVK